MYISVSVGNLSWQHRWHPWAGGKRLSHLRSPPKLLSPQWWLTHTRDLGFPGPHWDGWRWSSSCDYCSPLSLLLGWRPVKTNKPQLEITKNKFQVKEKVKRKKCENKNKGILNLVYSNQPIFIWHFSYIKFHNVLHRGWPWDKESHFWGPSRLRGVNAHDHRECRHSDHPGPGRQEAPHRGAEPSSHPGWSYPWDGTHVGRPELLPVWKVPMGETLVLKTEGLNQ